MACNWQNNGLQIDVVNKRELKKTTQRERERIKIGNCECSSRAQHAVIISKKDMEKIYIAIAISDKLVGYLLLMDYSQQFTNKKKEH